MQRRGRGLTDVVTQCHQHAFLYKADDDKLFEQRVHSPGGQTLVGEDEGKGRWRWGVL